MGPGISSETVERVERQPLLRVDVVSMDQRREAAGELRGERLRKSEPMEPRLAMECLLLVLIATDCLLLVLGARECLLFVLRKLSAVLILLDRMWVLSCRSSDDPALEAPGSASRDTCFMAVERVPVLSDASLFSCVEVRPEPRAGSPGLTNTSWSRSFVFSFEEKETLPSDVSFGRNCSKLVVDS